MKCAVCNKALKNPESIKKGVGPVCERKVMGKRVRVKKSKKDKQQLEMF